MLILIFIQSKSVWYINLENVVKIKDKSSGINFKRIKKKWFIIRTCLLLKVLITREKKNPLVHPFIRILFIVGVDYGREKRKDRRTNGKSLLKITLRKITTERPDVINEILYPVK